MQGSGVEGDPYLVETAEDLYNVRNNLAAYYEQVADISLSDYDNWEPIENFEGFYDGNGYEIADMFFDDTDYDGNAVGLFGRTENAEFININIVNFEIITSDDAGFLVGNGFYGLTIKNCNVLNSKMTNDITIGGLVGVMRDWSEVNSFEIKDCTIKDVTLEDDVESDWDAYVGGVVGVVRIHELDSSCLIENCFVDAECYAGYGGGLISAFCEGTNKNTEIKKCVGKGISNSTGAGEHGGLFGNTNDIIIEETYAEVNVDAPECWATGGIVGFLENTEIVNCYIRGEAAEFNTDLFVSGGGVAGWTDGGEIENCYSTFHIAPEWEYSGGLVGFADLTIENSYYDEELSGQSGDNGEARTTEEMTYPHHENTYVDWQFDEIWFIYDFANDGYPVLEEKEPPEPPEPDEIILYFTRTPRVRTEQLSANTVTVFSPEAEYTAQKEGISADEVIERTVSIDEGDEEVCKKVAEKLLERWGRTQVSILGSIDLNFGLDFMEEVKIRVPEATLDSEDDYYPLRKVEHNITDYTSTVWLGDLILSDSELLARILDEIY